MPKLRPLFFALLLAALGTAAYAGYRAHTRRAATLNRMAALDGCLAICNEQRAREAAGTVTKINNSVQLNHNLPKDVAVLKESQQIQARTKSLADTLRQLRQQWQTQGNAQAGKLPAQFASYRQFIRQYVPDALLLAQSSAPSQTTGWLSQFDLAAEPLPAALATLTRLETQVRQCGAAALAAQAAKVGSHFDGFTKIGVGALAASQTVAPGAAYEARLFLTLSAGGLKQHMSADGRPVLIDPKTGHGAVRFRIPAARSGQPDTLRAQWRGAIIINDNGRDTVFAVRVPYFIVKRPTL